MYKVKNFRNIIPSALQLEVKGWLESRNHIALTSVDFFNTKDEYYCTVVYTEINYML